MEILAKSCSYNVIKLTFDEHRVLHFVVVVAAGVVVGVVVVVVIQKKRS